MIPVGEVALDFELSGVHGDLERTWRLSEYRGQWLVVFFYPADFTFVCPTEVVGFHNQRAAFRDQKTEIVGISVDPVARHREWAKELGGIDYPLLSDPDAAVSQRYGAYDHQAGVARRVTFAIDPSGLAQYVVATHHNVGRSVEETLRVVRALQTGRLCPADWQPGDPTFGPELKY